MHPVFSSAYEKGVKPYMDGDMQASEAMYAVSNPFRDFMIAQTRESDIELFAEIGGYEPLQSAEDVPLLPVS